MERVCVCVLGRAGEGRGVYLQDIEDCVKTHQKKVFVLSAGRLCPPNHVMSVHTPYTQSFDPSLLQIDRFFYAWTSGSRFVLFLTQRFMSL